MLRSKSTKRHHGRNLINANRLRSDETISNDFQDQHLIIHSKQSQDRHESLRHSIKKNKVKSRVPKFAKDSIHHKPGSQPQISKQRPLKTQDFDSPKSKTNRGYGLKKNLYVKSEKPASKMNEGGTWLNSS